MKRNKTRTISRSLCRRSYLIVRHHTIEEEKQRKLIIQSECHQMIPRKMRFSKGFLNIQVSHESEQTYCIIFELQLLSGRSIHAKIRKSIISMKLF